ncbi:MAG: ABC transporter ATP-binding protein [Hyphomicrobiales bacterium]
MASIRFQGVTKRFGDIVAVDDVSFEVEDNEFFCLFGPPLSGKTTILKLILGLEQPDEGEVFIAGAPVTHVEAPNRNVAMVFQNLALFPHLTAEENVRFPLVERGLPRDQIGPRVRAVAEKMHMTHILHKHPAQLSGGERQRVAIARALVRDPVAYLMDDPISALDARLREQTRIELRRIQRELNHTLIYVTHDQEEAMSISDRMAILEAGRVRQIAEPETLYDDPNSEYVAEMLGAPRMNLFSIADIGTDGMVATQDAFPDRAVRAGLRPESVLVNRTSDGAGRVRTVEPMGATTIVTIDAGQREIKALLRGQPSFEAGEPVQLGAAPGRLHFFDSQGAALRCG